MTAQAHIGVTGTVPPLEWDWDIEHADRKREALADKAQHGAMPFEVDRRVLKDVVLEHMKTPVARIVFLSAGTFHKAYLVTLTSSHQVVARVARRFMPRLKTESEIATLRYLREKTQLSVPEIHHYDSNPYNRLGGEYIIMSKAPGIPLSQAYHSMPYAKLVQLMDNLAKLYIPLFGHRFPRIGSLYNGPDPTTPSPSTSNSPTPTLTRGSSLVMSSLAEKLTPRANQEPYTAFPFSPTLTPRVPAFSKDKQPFHVGPIISWPFFGTHRGDLPSTDVPRGPFSSSQEYFAACVNREILGVQRENAGSAAGHKLHLDPAEIRSSRHHHVAGVPGDESDDSDEWDLEESEDEWEGPGDVMYRDYRRQQRSTFLIPHMNQREDAVRREMARWMGVMETLRAEWRAGTERVGVGGKQDEEFALDAHDMSLENVFVDSQDPSIITCIIDWESTTTRPLWAAAHLPAFLQSSPFTAKLFREAVGRLASSDGSKMPLLAREWLHHERTGMRLRMAHRVVEWDGWEEGLVDSILGPPEAEEEWYHDPDTVEQDAGSPDSDLDESLSESLESEKDGSLLGESLSRRRDSGEKAKAGKGGAATGKPTSKLFAKNLEREKEQMLDTTGDICGGRGGELGRRLEAWLTVSENASPEETANGYQWPEGSDPGNRALVET
ncbi:hypothetical protein MIND_01354900 [Mycena indigotica]|uniref:Aminoglycoside phosphotransferase domain-containing protein n=1 Tax=Mycena indigotica TaxID=2126181 RepID=A0A8H6RZE2_9AGAR|nr:uncharacterized protein MIND_01354900 [Mycena indigotica]KAF7289806.1 hypothetical protein MIND_01354900 [Mycena indigotica]